MASAEAPTPTSVSIPVSIDPETLRHLTPGIPADRAVCQRITDMVSDSGRGFVGLISVRSVVQLHSGPFRRLRRSRRWTQICTTADLRSAFLGVIWSFAGLQMPLAGLQTSSAASSSLTLHGGKSPSAPRAGSFKR
jgi:hypothetical protein